MTDQARPDQRLAKRLAEMLPCSRREAEQFIEGGWVTVDGVVVEEPQFRVSTQTIAFDDYINFKGEQGAKDAGKMRSEGKEYVVKDGEVMNFLFSS